MPTDFDKWALDNLSMPTDFDKWALNNLSMPTDFDKWALNNLSMPTDFDKWALDNFSNRRFSPDSHPKESLDFCQRWICRFLVALLPHWLPVGFCQRDCSSPRAFLESTRMRRMRRVRLCSPTVSFSSFLFFF
jgi:hypothetical protein